MKEYDELETKEVFKNNHIKVFTKKLRLPDDRVVEWTFTGKKDAVGVIAIKDKDSVLFVKQYRPAIKKVSLEIPAGFVEEGEDVISAGLRELEEETGYRAKNIEKICEYYMSPALSGGKITLFYAYDLVKTEQNLDEDEFVEVEEIKLEDVDIDMLADGKSIIALEYVKKKYRI